MTESVTRQFLDLSGDPAALTRRLCDIESVSGSEKTIADQIDRALRNLKRYQVFREGNTIVARSAGSGTQRVILAGHLDTVPLSADRNLPTWCTGTGNDQRIYGRGTADMKGGVAVQLSVAAAAVDPACELTFIFYDGEEISAEHNGLLKLSKSHPELLHGDFAILLEPTSGQLEGGCNGTMRVDIQVPGVAAHSARSWIGKNAIHAAAEVLQRLQDWPESEVLVDELPYREGLNAVGISGGIAGNVIPDRCTVTVNYRFAPNKTVAQAEAYLREFFSGFELAVTDSAPGARPGLDRPLIQEFVRALGVSVGPKYGWTDVARFSALGIPAVNFGPGDPLKAHADDEYVLAQEVRDCASALLAWLCPG